jgi:hypothetical protein
VPQLSQCPRRRVRALFKLADTIEKRVAAGTGMAERVTQAVLAKAFCDELVPTEAELARIEGRSYETAADLLARVKGGKEFQKDVDHSTAAINVIRT